MENQDIRTGDYVTVNSRNVNRNDIYKVVRIPNNNSLRSFYHLELAYISISSGYYHQSSAMFDDVRHTYKYTCKTILKNIKLFDDSNIPGGLRW